MASETSQNNISSMTNINIMNETGRQTAAFGLDMLGDLVPDARLRLIEPDGPTVAIECSVEGKISHIVVLRRVLVKFSIFAARNLSRADTSHSRAQQPAGLTSQAQSGRSIPAVQLPLTAIRMQTPDPNKPAIQLPQPTVLKSTTIVAPESAYSPQRELLILPPDSVYPDGLGYVYRWMENGCKSRACLPLQPEVDLWSNLLILQVIKTLGIRTCENRFKSWMKGYINDKPLDANEVSIFWEELQCFDDIIKHLVHNLAWDAFHKRDEWTDYDSVDIYVKAKPDLETRVDEQYRFIEVAAAEKAERVERRKERAETGRRQGGARASAARVQEAAKGLRELNMTDYIRARGSIV